MMKHMKKKLLALTLVWTLLSGVVPWVQMDWPTVSASSESGDFVIENGVLTKYQGTGGNVVIPDTVTKIGNDAFAYCTGLISITIPNSVTSIDSETFSHCTGLTSVTIPDSVTSIGNYAFKNCTSLQDVYYGGSEEQWKAVSIGSNNESLTGATIHYAQEERTPLAITTQPKNTAGASGQSCTISTAATGDGVTYQWFIKQADASAWSQLDGQTDASLTFTPDSTWNGAKFYCHLEDKWGNKVNTASVVLTVDVTPLKITIQPKNTAGASGQSCTISTAATGDNVTYQWFIKQAGASAWSKMDGQTDASLTFTPDSTWNGTKFYCHIEDKWGNKVNTASVVLTVDVTPLAITIQPKNTAGVSGQSCTISTAATGDGVTYQWFIKKADASAWSQLDGQTAASLTFTPDATWNGTKFYCRIEDKWGNKVNTASVVFTLNT